MSKKTLWISRTYMQSSGPQQQATDTCWHFSCYIGAACRNATSVWSCIACVVKRLCCCNMHAWFSPFIFCCCWRFLCLFVLRCNRKRKSVLASDPLCQILIHIQICSNWMAHFRRCTSAQTRQQSHQVTSLSVKWQQRKYQRPAMVLTSLDSCCLLNAIPSSCRFYAVVVSLIFFDFFSFEFFLCYYLLSVAFLLHIPMPLWCHAMILLLPLSIIETLGLKQFIFCCCCCCCWAFFLSCKLRQLLRF